MKSFHTTIICAVLGLAIFLPCAGAAENPAKQSDVNTAMRDTVIAGTNLSGFSASDMINYLQWMAGKHELNIIVKNECATWETRSGKLSLQTGNISFRELADKVSTTTQTLYRISGNDLIFYPRFHPSCGQDPIVSKLSVEDSTLSDIVPLLQTLADHFQLGITIKNECHASFPTCTLTAEYYTYGELLAKVAEGTNTVFIAKDNELIFYPQLHPITRTYNINLSKLATLCGKSNTDTENNLTYLLKEAGVLIPVDSKFIAGKNGKNITVTAPLITHKGLQKLVRDIEQASISKPETSKKRAGKVKNNYKRSRTTEKHTGGKSY